MARIQRGKEWGGSTCMPLWYPLKHALKRWGIIRTVEVGHLLMISESFAFVYFGCRTAIFSCSIQAGLPQLIYIVPGLYVRLKIRPTRLQHFLFCVPLRSTIMKVITSAAHGLFNPVIGIWFTCICPLGLSSLRLQGFHRQSLLVRLQMSFL